MLPRPCHCRRKPCHRRRQKHDSRPHSFLSQFSHCCRTLFFGRLFPTPSFFCPNLLQVVILLLLEALFFCYYLNCLRGLRFPSVPSTIKRSKGYTATSGETGRGGQGGGGRGSTQHIVPHLNKPDLAVRPSRTFFRRRMYLSSGIFAGL